MMKRDRLHFVDGYVAGAAEFASASCQGMKSYNMTAFCYNPEPEFYIHSMAKEFGMKDEEIELAETNRTLDDFLEDHLGENDFANSSINYLKEMIYMRIGNEVKSMVFSDEAKIRNNFSAGNGGSSSFFHVEELFVQIYEEGTVLFVIGSDEE